MTNSSNKPLFCASIALLLASTSAFAQAEPQSLPEEEGRAIPDPAIAAPQEVEREGNETPKNPSAPVSLGEPIKPTVPEPVELGTPTVSRDPMISVSDAADDVSVDGFGLIGEEKGGYAEDAWQGLTRPQANALLESINGGIVSDALREQMVMLLSSTATPPKPDAAGFLNARLKTLVTIGKDDRAAEILAAIPADRTTDQLAQISADMLLLKRDYDGVCAKAAPAVERYATAYWQRLMVFCQQRTGQKNEAELGLSLLEEQNQKADAFFLEMLAAIDPAADGKKAITSFPKNPSVTDAAMLFATKQVKLPKDYLTTAPLAIMRTVVTAQDATISAEVKASAAERLVLFGMAPAKTLVDSYLAITFTEKELATAPETAATISGVRGSALLYQLQKKQPTPQKRAAVIKLAFAHFEKSGLRSLAMKLYADDMAQISVNLSHDSVFSAVSATAIDTLIFSDKLSAASRWHSFLPEQGSGALSRFIYAEVIKWREAKDAGTLTITLPKAMPKEASASEIRKLFRLYSLAGALGQSLNDSDWQAISGYRADARVEIASPLMPAKLAKAVEDDEAAKAVLLMVVMAGGSDLDKASDEVLATIVRGLVSLGQHKAAARFAAEAIAAVN